MEAMVAPLCQALERRDVLSRNGVSICVIVLTGRLPGCALMRLSCLRHLRVILWAHSRRPTTWLTLL